MSTLLYLWLNATRWSRRTGAGSGGGFSGDNVIAAGNDPELSRIVGNFAVGGVCFVHPGRDPTRRQRRVIALAA